MRWQFLTGSLVCVLSAMVLNATFAVSAQPESSPSSPPPIAQQLVREGTFALKLANVLEVVSTDDEIEAESSLGDVGISPKNGWIADYPVTPDIIAEVQSAVSATADADKLHFEKGEALKRFERVKSELSLAVIPYSGTAKVSDPPPANGRYPDPTVINNYYVEQGPPVVTYYAPPADYYYLYGWVPFAFWSFGFWYPGYYILNDFHRVAHYGNRSMVISNHFNGGTHRMYRIDPAARYAGRTYAGIGAVRSRSYIATGVPQSDRRVFNASRNSLPARSGQTYSRGSRGAAPVMRSEGAASRGGRGGGSVGGRSGSGTHLQRK